MMEMVEKLVRNHPANKELKYMKRKKQTEYASDSPDSEYSFYKKVTMYHEAHLEHYLRVCGGRCGDVLKDIETDEPVLDIIVGSATYIQFNLTTGKPATEKDAEEFIRLVEGV